MGYYFVADPGFVRPVFQQRKAFEGRPQPFAAHRRRYVGISIFCRGSPARSVLNESPSGVSKSRKMMYDPANSAGRESRIFLFVWSLYTMHVELDHNTQHLVYNPQTSPLLPIKPPSSFPFALPDPPLPLKSLQLYTSDRCPTLPNSPGPITPTHRSFLTRCTSRKRIISPGPSSLQYSMVRRLCGRLSALTLFIRFIVLGVDIALFFQCMSAIFNPVYRTKKAVKWGLATHIFVMFSVSTVAIAITRRTFSLAYIDNREVPVAGLYPSGPLEYMQSTNFSLGVMQIIATLSFPINQWLVDGLLVSCASTQSHRCLM